MVRSGPGTAVVVGLRLLWRTSAPWVASTLVLQILLGLLPAVELALLARLIDVVAGDGGGRPPVGLMVALAASIAARNVAEHSLSALHPNTAVTPLVLRFVFRLVGMTRPARFDEPAFLDLVQRAGGGVASHATTTLMTLGESLRAAVGAGAMLGLLASMDVRLTALAVVAAAPVLFVARLDGVDSARAWSGDSVEARMRGYLSQLLRDPSAGAELRALRLAPHLLARLAKLFAERVAVLRSLARRARNRALLVAMIQSTVTVAALAVVVSDAVAGIRGPGDVIIGVGSVAALSALLSRLAEVLGYLTTAAPYLSPAAELEAEVKAGERPGRKTALPLAEGPIGLHLADVEFRYPGAGDDVIRGVTLEVKPGELVALVGENGAGKSTLVRLAIGVVSAQRGRLRVSGTDLEDLDLEAFWRRVGFLPQFPLRPEMPLRNAVALGVPWEQPDDERIVAALEAVGAADLVSSVTLDGVLGRAWEKGHDLSGGQWQRVALARIVYRRPDLWVLDEPTSNLDPSAEAELVSGLRRLLGDATCVFISHRFSTVRSADRIGVLDHGVLVEVGSHDELIAREGRYARLFELQASGYR